MIKQLYQRFISLKSMWWTHVLVWSANISLLVFLFFELIAFMGTQYEKSAGVACFAIVIYFGFYIAFNFILFFISLVIFIFEAITKFRFKITNKLILTNPVYHIFWLTGFISFLFVIYLYLYFTIFYY